MLRRLLWCAVAVESFLLCSHQHVDSSDCLYQGLRYSSVLQQQEQLFHQGHDRNHTPAKKNDDDRHVSFNLTATIKIIYPDEPVFVPNITVARRLIPMRSTAEQQTESETHNYS